MFGGDRNQLSNCRQCFATQHIDKTPLLINMLKYIYFFYPLVEKKCPVPTTTTL